MPTSAPARRTRALRAIALAFLLLGYGDLARGGLTVAPVLLVAGYMLLVPLAILLD
jgi:hypothetical protein